MIFSKISQAQNNRSIDISVEFAKPLSGEIIYAPCEYNLKIKLKNKGPDNIIVNDQFVFYLSSSDTSILGPKIHNINSTIPKGDSILISCSIPVKTDIPSDFYKIAVSTSYIMNLGTDTIIPETQAQEINNRAFVITSIRSNKVSVTTTSKNKYFISPNPAINFIKLNTTSHTENIHIIDPQGRVCITDIKPNVNIDVSHLSSGNYLIKVFSGSTVSCLKFIKL